MFGIIMTCVFVMLTSILWGLDMYNLEELAYVISIALPLYIYAKDDDNLWGACFFVQALTLVSRLPILSIVASKIDSTDIAVVSSNQLFIQLSGMIMIVGWIIWLLCIGAMVLGTCKHVLRECNTLGEINKDTTIHRANNILNMTTILIIVDLVQTLYAYALTDYSGNIVLFGVIAVTICICIYMWEVSLINERKKQIIEVEFEKYDKKPISGKVKEAVDAYIHREDDVTEDSDK